MNFGLSADTEYADRIRELANKKFLTNSDAHSLPKIAREYNTFEMENISFKSFKKVLGYEDEIQNGDNKETKSNSKNRNKTLCRWRNFSRIIRHIVICVNV